MGAVDEWSGSSDWMETSVNVLSRDFSGVR